MSSVDTTLIQDLKSRGLVAQMTNDTELAQHLSQPRTLYCGFDPTADSLHIGSLVPLVTLRRFQNAGHTPIALVGGATGLIGDPSFKAQERKLNTPDVVANWVDKLKLQVSKFIDFDATDNAASVVNNLDWTQNVTVLDFLRDVGKYFSINNMIQKESVKQRLDREGAGISFTEFSYMTLQSYDFAELYHQHECTVQIGGSDQWGNITGGIDLARRMYQGQTYGLTMPLVTKSDGTKFGKTESGTIWLDAKKTSPYSFYQFWLSCSDDDVYKFLKYFTFMSVADIDKLEKEDQERGGRPQAQYVLAEQVTKLVHGVEGFDAAYRISQAMFSGDLTDLSEGDFEQLMQDGLPSSSLDSGSLNKPLTSLLVDCGMVKAGREVKDALSRKAVFINGEAKGSEDNMNTATCFDKSKALYSRFFLIKLGKKKNHLLELI